MSSPCHPTILQGLHPELYAKDLPDAQKIEANGVDDERLAEQSTGNDEPGIKHVAAVEEGEEELNTADPANEAGDKPSNMPDTAGGQVTKSSQHGIFSPSQRGPYIGFLAQYFVVGIIYAGVPATTYGVFLGYLNVPAFVYATVSIISTLPWSFKFLFGMINDTMPMYGLRRKPYMMIGWSLCTVALLVLGCTPLPEPYWCVDEAGGKYITKVIQPDGSAVAAMPCNPEAATQGAHIAILLMLACLGYVIADVAADGLTTEYARQEPIERRGKIQTTAYLTRSLGGIFSIAFVGLCMNGHKYNGSFSWSLSFEAVCVVFAIPTALMVPLSGFLVKEPCDPDRRILTGYDYLSTCWDLLKSKACFYVIIYFFFTNAITGISTPASGQIKRYWAQVENLQNQMFSLVGHLIFAGGLGLVKRYLLGASWRVLLTVTIVMLQVIDSVFSSLTIFDVVRNQYFYLGETVLIEIPTAANFVISTFVIVEMAENGNEGMVYGLLTTTANLGTLVGRAIGNQLYTVFQPSLSDSANYIEDSPEFRRTVFHSFMLSYSFPILALCWAWYFLPDQKQQAQDRKNTWKKRPIYGVFTLCLLGVAFSYALLVNFGMDTATQIDGFENGLGHRML